MLTATLPLQAERLNLRGRKEAWDGWSGKLARSIAHSIAAAFAIFRGHAPALPERARHNKE
jgi:hypothetical protein